MLGESSSLSERSWARSFDPISKAGYMNGAADGQTAQFQSSFDLGFQKGVCFGFELGQDDALHSVSKQQNAQHPHRDFRSVNCEICENNVMPQQNVPS